MWVEAAAGRWLWGLAGAVCVCVEVGLSTSMSLWAQGGDALLWNDLQGACMS